MSLKNILILLLVIVVILFGGYLLYKMYWMPTSDSSGNQIVNTDTNSDTNLPVENIENPDQIDFEEQEALRQAEEEERRAVEEALFEKEEEERRAVEEALFEKEEEERRAVEQEEERQRIEAETQPTAEEKQAQKEAESNINAGGSAVDVNEEPNAENTSPASF